MAGIVGFTAPKQINDNLRTDDLFLQRTFIGLIVSFAGLDGSQQCYAAVWARNLNSQSRLTIPVNSVN